ATEFSGPRAEEALRDELQLLRPRETLLPRPPQLFETAKTSLLEGTGGIESRLEDWTFQRDYGERILREQFGVAELTGFGLDAHRRVGRYRHRHGGAPAAHLASPAASRSRCDRSPPRRRHSARAANRRSR